MSGLDPSGPQLAVVVVNYGSSALLLDNLSPLQPSEPNVHVVVVDNFSTAAERQRLASLCQRQAWHLVGSPDNRGFGGGANLGVQAAKELGCVVFVLLNPDASIEPATLRALRDETLANPMTMAAPSIRYPDGRPGFAGNSILMERGRTGRPRPDERGEIVPWLGGACLAIHTQLWDLLGGFDDDYFLYWEDVDLSYRCIKNGGRLLLREDLTAVHSVGGTQGGLRNKSPAYYFNNCRNRLLFAAKHLPPRLIVRWLLRTPAYGRAVVLRGGRRQLLRPWSPVTSALGGSASGVGIAVGALLKHLAARSDRIVARGTR